MSKLNEAQQMYVNALEMLNSYSEREEVGFDRILDVAKFYSVGESTLMTLWEQTSDRKKYNVEINYLLGDWPDPTIFFARVEATTEGRARMYGLQKLNRKVNKRNVRKVNKVTMQEVIA